MNPTKFSEIEKYTINKQVPEAVYRLEKARYTNNGYVDGY